MCIINTMLRTFCVSWLHDLSTNIQRKNKTTSLLPKWPWNHIFLGTQFIIILVFVFLNLSICHSHQHRSQMISPMIESAPWSVSAGQMWGASDCKYSIVNKIINKILRRINREMARYWSRVTWSPGRGGPPDQRRIDRQSSPMVTSVYKTIFTEKAHFHCCKCLY